FSLRLDDHPGAQRVEARGHSLRSLRLFRCIREGCRTFCKRRVCVRVRGALEPVEWSEQMSRLRYPFTEISARCRLCGAVGLTASSEHALGGRLIDWRRSHAPVCPE